MLNVGHIAKTFGMLPSHVLEFATTYDLMIADVMSTWEDYQYKKAAGKSVEPEYTQEELLKIFEQGKNNNDTND